MDDIVMKAGTALVTAMTAEAWAQAKDAVVRLWRKGHPDDAGRVGTDLDQLRSQVVAAQRDRDTATLDALTGQWRMRLQELLAHDPLLRAELAGLTLAHQVPAGAVTGGQSESTTVTAYVSGGTCIQAGRDAHVQPPAAPAL